jgi:hypothetical protein
MIPNPIHISNKNTSRNLSSSQESIKLKKSSSTSSKNELNNVSSICYNGMNNSIKVRN